MTDDTLLEVRNLTLDIPTGGGTLHAVRGIDFDLKRGETLCIVGESGSRQIADLARADGPAGQGHQRSADVMRFDGDGSATASCNGRCAICAAIAWR